MRNLAAVLPLLIALAGGTYSLEPVPDVPAATIVDSSELTTRVVDVGPGLCAITRIPGGHAMVFDGGHWLGGYCLKAAREILGNSPIDLVIISHSDGDHIGDIDEILGEFVVKGLIRTGFRRNTSGWNSMNDRIAEETKGGASVYNLASWPLVPGLPIRLGDATLTLIAGWHEWSLSDLSPSEGRNVISIVAKLEYRGRSILFTGDTVGRRLTDDDTACRDAERVMTELHDDGIVDLKSDVLIAPHHGGNNGSSSCFISRVNPDYVVFSAGHKYNHPTRAAVGRYLAQGVEESKIFRTDRGDDESGGSEWKKDSVKGCIDPKGDDDVEITIGINGEVRVSYRYVQSGC